MTSYTYEARFTRNMGNFESLQIHEGLTDDARPGERVDTLRERVQGKVNGWLFESVENVEREIRGLRKRLDEESAAKARGSEAARVAQGK